MQSPPLHMAFFHYYCLIYAYFTLHPKLRCFRPEFVRNIIDFKSSMFLQLYLHSKRRGGMRILVTFRNALPFTRTEEVSLDMPQLFQDGHGNEWYCQSYLESRYNFDDVEVYDVTLVLHGSSFKQQCNRSKETTGLNPYMGMAALREYKLYMIWPWKYAYTTFKDD